jgi:hypothetical protein
LADTGGIHWFAATVIFDALHDKNNFVETSMKHRIVTALLGIPVFFIALFIGSIILGTVKNQRSLSTSPRRD